MRKVDRIGFGHIGAALLLAPATAHGQAMGKMPEGKDVTEFYLAGGDVYHWIEKELGEQMSIPERLPYAP